MLNDTNLETMENKIEITAVNGFELLFEDARQRNSEQEIEIKLNDEVFIICSDIYMEYLEEEVYSDEQGSLNEWRLNSLDVDYITAYNEDGAEVELSKEDINDIETYLEFNLRN